VLDCPNLRPLGHCTPKRKIYMEFISPMAQRLRNFPSYVGLCSMAVAGGSDSPMAHGTQ
jgi:hypothetical protein